MQIYGSVNVKLRLKEQDPGYTGSEVLTRLNDMIENSPYVPKNQQNQHGQNNVVMSSGDIARQIMESHKADDANYRLTSGTVSKRKQDTPSKPPKVPTGNSHLQKSGQNRNESGHRNGDVRKSQEGLSSSRQRIVITGGRTDASVERKYIGSVAASREMTGAKDAREGSLTNSRRFGNSQGENRVIKLTKDVLGTPNRGAITSTRRLVIGATDNSRNQSVNSNLQSVEKKKILPMKNSSNGQTGIDNIHNSNFMNNSGQHGTANQDLKESMMTEIVIHNFRDRKGQELQSSLLHRGPNYMSNTFTDGTHQQPPKTQPVTESKRILAYGGSKPPSSNQGNRASSKTRIVRSYKKENPKLAQKTPIQQAYENQRGVKLNINNKYLINKKNSLTATTTTSTGGVNILDGTRSDNPVISRHHPNSTTTISKRENHYSNLQTLEDGKLGTPKMPSSQAMLKKQFIAGSSHQRLQHSGQKTSHVFTKPRYSGSANKIPPGSTAQIVRTSGYKNRHPSQNLNGSFASNTSTTLQNRVRGSFTTPNQIGRTISYQEKTEKISTTSSQHGQKLNILTRGTSRDPSTRRLKLNTSNHLRGSSYSNISRRQLQSTPSGQEYAYTQGIRGANKISINGLNETRNVYAPATTSQLNSAKRGQSISSQNREQIYGGSFTQANQPVGINKLNFSMPYQVSNIEKSKDFAPV